MDHHRAMGHRLWMAGNNLAEAQQVPAVEVHPFGTLDLRMHAGSGRGVEVNRLCRGDSPGLEVAATAKDRSVDAVIVLMTGWDFDADQVEGGRVVDLVLSKPFERDTVIERVRDAQQMVESRRTVARDMAG